ncbi:hypothetical protein M758_UG132500 [Ceratodon purpureus]|nr:hypothetical protein M758_UG132500 [Ceratodon purpureus]
MADTVAYHMERMLPELEDLEKRGLFSKQELKEIVRQRRDFEYLLKRHSALKQDFLRYVDYETQLESARKERKEVICRDLRTKGEGWKSSICDRSSAMRIMLIYERAVTKFKGDLELWLRYAEYCRSQGSRRVQKVLMKAIQLHPAVPGLWIYAAVWEAEHNSNVTAARALMQQGLRACPKSETLWLEYFRMELIFAEKVKARRLVLGISTPETPAITEAGEDGDDGDMSKSETDGDEVKGKATVSHFAASCKIAQVIYRKSISEIPDNLRFRQRFLEILESIDVEKLMVLEGEIYAGIRERFVTDEDSWAWLARRQFVKAESKGMDIMECRKDATKVYDEALQSVNSARMYEHYAEFLIGNLEYDDEHLEADDLASENGQMSTLDQSAEILLKLYIRAKAAGVESETLAQGHAGLLLRLGNIDLAREAVEVSCNESASTCGSARIWTLLLSLETKRVSEKKLDSSEQQLAKLLKASLKNATDDVKTLLQIAVEVQTVSRKSFDGFLQLLESILAGTSRKQAGAEVASALVDWVLHAEGLQRAREIYTRLIALPSPGLNFLKSCIAMEAGLVSEGNGDALKQLRKLFNLAVELYGHFDEGLWLEYCSQERKAGNIEEASNVYWRAKKALQNPSSFLERYQLLR